MNTWIVTALVMLVLASWIWALLKWVREEPDNEERNRVLYDLSDAGDVLAYERAKQRLADLNTASDEFAAEVKATNKNLSEMFGGRFIDPAASDAMARMTAFWDKQGYSLSASEALRQKRNADIEQFTHEFFAAAADADNWDDLRCGVLVNGEPCGKTAEEH